MCIRDSICAIPNRPEYYNPLKNSENAVTRRDKILQDMYECGYITKDAGEEALVEQITIAEPEEEETFYNYEVTYAINCAVRYLMKLDGFEFQYDFDTDEEYNEYNDRYDESYQQAKHKLYTGGYKVTTTMNLNAQKSLQNILDEQLEFNTEVNEETGIFAFQGAMTVIDNKTGKVVAMIGGRSQEEIRKTYSLNRAYQSYAQPGSSFKPLVVYTPALEQGYSDSSQLKNIDVSAAKKSTAEKISQMSGKSMTLRHAVEQSENGAAYWLFNDLTPKVGLSYVKNMNFSKIVSNDYNLSAALGGLTYGASTVEMANAYSTLENHGEYTQTDCISSILDSAGNEIYEEPVSKTVYTREAADEMTDILKGVLTKGTAKNLKWYSYTDTEAAGKTGTTNDNKAAWFCGYTPQYTIAVWVGYDQPRKTNGLWGHSYPAYIWKEAMLYMIDGLDTESFDLGSFSSGSGVQPSDEEIPEEETEQEPEDGVQTDEPDNGNQTGDTINGEIPGASDPTEDITGGEINQPSGGQDQPQKPENPDDTIGKDPDAEPPAGTDTGNTDSTDTAQ